ncbi:MAG: DUF1476 domain-containing protein [Caulobacterales bacterium]
MTTFDDRERGFEAAFVHDAEVEFKATARRDRFLGAWAGRLMGLSGQDLVNYAAAVVQSDFKHPGDADVLHKIARDLAASGVKTAEETLRGKMGEFLSVAREQIHAGQ